MVAERKGAAAPNYILSDHLGSTSTIVDANGNNPKNTYYYSFGSMRLNTGSGLTDNLYTGQKLDSSSNNLSFRVFRG